MKKYDLTIDDYKAIAYMDKLNNLLGWSQTDYKGNGHDGSLQLFVTEQLDTTTLNEIKNVKFYTIIKQDENKKLYPYLCKYV